MNHEELSGILPERIDEAFPEMDIKTIVALKESDDGYAALADERDSVTRRSTGTARPFCL
jgi:hypothetical protein